ncbi:MAG TPA: ABC transporter permease [Vicinamibacterales bacterium]|nr:ABC transporter permease [Vicinamibacterales bacterium]
MNEKGGWAGGGGRHAAADRLYRLILRVYPAPFRDRFGADLLDLFHDKRRAIEGRGPIRLAAFWSRILRDAAITAIAERLRPTQIPHERGPLMQGLPQDIRYAWRMIERRPALAVVIILTLALGIGANTAIFSLVNTVLLRPSPYRQADRLVMIWEQQPERSPGGQPVRPANFFEWKGRATSFEDVAWSRDGMFSLTGEGEPESIIGYRFSANMLDVLGVQPALGRAFSPDEDKPGGARVVILSDRLWKRRFSADRGILGRTLTLNGQPYTVVGVMPPQFRHPQLAQLWTPLALTPELAANRRNGMLRLVGRLKPGVSADEAQAEVAAVYQDLADRHPDTNKGLSAMVEAFGGTGDARPLLLILFAGVGFVLLIACANVANLLLADASSRRRELAVRSALGASRYRVVRQMLTESLILAFAGGALGVLATWWTKDSLVMLFPSNIANLDLPLVEQIDVGAGVFLFALLVSAATGLIFGMLPAWKIARSNLQGALKDGDRGGSSSRRTHSVLVITEVALSIVLLAGALLMVQSFMRVQRLELGFDADRVLSGRVILPAYRYPDLARIQAFTRALVPRLQQIPGVQSAGIVTNLPLSGWSGAVDFSIEGRPEQTGSERPSASYQSATEDYFRAMAIPLLAGRTFSPGDDRSRPRVVVINQALAKKYWPGENPVGRRVVLDGRAGPLPHEIVGIVGDVRSAGLEEPIEGEMYFSSWQGADAILCIVLRTSGDPAALAGQLRAAVWSVDREQPVTYVMPMSELAAESLAFRRAGMMLASGFGLLALVLAAIGIYGVLSYGVTRRTREIGIRMALGATRGEVAKVILREGLLMTGIGVAIGLTAAFGLSRFLASLLFDVKPGDPLTYAAVAAILITVALLATVLPARRATSVDPLVALRAE